MKSIQFPQHMLDQFNAATRESHPVRFELDGRDVRMHLDLPSGAQITSAAVVIPGPVLGRRQPKCACGLPATAYRRDIWTCRPCGASEAGR